MKALVFSIATAAAVVFAFPVTAEATSAPTMRPQTTLFNHVGPASAERVPRPEQWDQLRRWCPQDACPLPR